MPNAKITVAIFGLIVFLVVMGTALHSVMAQQSKPVAPGIAATSQSTTVVSKYGPAKTPKETVKAAFAAACAGDEAGFLSCFDQPSDADQKILKVVVNVLAAAEELRNSVSDKFRAPVADNFFEATGMGVNGSEIANSDEAIADSQATVDIHGGPGKIPLSKIGGVWKILPTVLVNLDRQGVEAEDQLAPEMRLLARNLKAGKYKTIEEFRNAAAERLKVIPKN